MLAAIAATVGHGLHVLNRRDREATAMRAGNLASPAVRLEILAGSFLAGEALEELIEADGFRFRARAL
jgi:hypothetical protein